jgi:hypothetical protein
MSQMGHNGRAGFALAPLRPVLMTLEPRFELGLERVVLREHVAELGHRFGAVLALKAGYVRVVKVDN